MLSSVILMSVQDLFATVGRWMMELESPETVIWLEVL